MVCLHFLFYLIVFYWDTTLVLQRELSVPWVCHLHLLFSPCRTFWQDLVLATYDFTAVVLVIFTLLFYILGPSVWRQSNVLFISSVQFNSVCVYRAPVTLWQYCASTGKTVMNVAPSLVSEFIVYLGQTLR